MSSPAGEEKKKKKKKPSAKKTEGADDDASPKKKKEKASPKKKKKDAAKDEPKLDTNFTFGDPDPGEDATAAAAAVQEQEDAAALPAAPPSPAKPKYKVRGPDEIRPYYAPQGVYSHVPVKTTQGRVFEDEAGEGEQVLIKDGVIRELLQATWGAGSHANQLDVTKLVKAKVVKGGLSILATNEVLCEPGYDPAPGQQKRLKLRYAEQHLTEPSKQLEKVDLASPEGQLAEAQLKNQRLTDENVSLKAQLQKHERRENHYRDVEERLKEELFKRKQLQQAVLDNEGAAVATRLQELERENVRLRVQLKNEQNAVSTEQKQRERVEADYNRLKATQGGPGKLVQEQVQTLRLENERLQQQLQDINRLNLNLQLTLKDQTEYDTLRASVFAMDNVDPTTGSVPMSSSHVRVRKSVLCAKCKANVELWERQAVSRGTAVTMTTLRDLQSTASSAKRPVVGGSPYAHRQAAAAQPPTPLSANAYAPYGGQQAPSRYGGAPGGYGYGGYSGAPHGGLGGGGYAGGDGGVVDL